MIDESDPDTATSGNSAANTGESFDVRRTTHVPGSDPYRRSISAGQFSQICEAEARLNGYTVTWTYEGDRLLAQYWMGGVFMGDREWTPSS